jgi:polysaccharide export outer membrane protein
MKPALLLLSFGLLSFSPGAFGQPPATRPDPAAALNPPPPPSETVPGGLPAPGMPPAEAASMPDPAPADIEPNYILGETDTIVVNVWKEPSLTGGLTIRPDGRISLPLIGDLPAAGLTPMALASEIASHLKKFMNDPTVTVTVTSSNSRRITFIGEVSHPGPLPLVRNMTMLQAIAAAGGVTPYANKKKIYILRGEQGKQQRIPFDYNKAVKKGDMQGVAPQSGDTVVVP